MLKSYESSRYFVPNPNLQSYFSRVRHGYSQVIRTPWYDKEDPQKILQRWMPTLEGYVSKRWPTLMEYEVDLAKKVGPMSVMKPLSERLKDVESYYEGILLPSTPLDDRCIAAVRAEWAQVGGLRLRSQRTTVESMKKSTNSGNPFFARRSSVVEETLPVTVRQGGGKSIQCIGPRDELWDCCAILGWRGQEGGPKPEDVKQRVVWMFPFAVNIAELQFYQVLIASAQRENLVPAWVGLDAVSDRITTMFDTKGKNDLVVCTDFSKFDQHFGFHMQEAAAKLIDALTAPEAKSWLRDVYPIKYQIPLAVSMNRMAFGRHGMGSGSGGTNADETLAHRALQYEAAIHSGSRLNRASQCLGDDGVLTYPGIRVEDVVNTYTAHGLEMNESKQYASVDDCTYLRRWYHRDFREQGKCVGVYSTCRAIGRMAELERWVDEDKWGPEAVALRQLSIIENCCYHPAFEAFVQFCMAGDIYRLGLDIPGFFDRLERKVQEAIDSQDDLYFGYNAQQMLQQKSINDWRVVRYLRSL